MLPIILLKARLWETLKLRRNSLGAYAASVCLEPHKPLLLEDNAG